MEQTFILKSRCKVTVMANKAMPAGLILCHRTLWRGCPKALGEWRLETTF